MSLKAVSWAIEQDLNPTHKCIMIMLAMFMNDETGLCCPSKAKLAALVNVSQATLKRQLAQLEKSEILIRKARFGEKSGLQTSNAYVINFKKGRRLKMSPLPQYDDEYFEAAQNEPADSPGGSPAEPAGGSPAEPPIKNLKGNLKLRGADARISKPLKEAEPPAGTEPILPEQRKKVGSLIKDFSASLRMSRADPPRPRRRKTA